MSRKTFRGYARTVHRSRVGNLVVYSHPDGDSDHLHVTARSARHAERIIATLGLHPYECGPGQPFAHRPFFNESAKRVEQFGGMDV